MSHVEGPKRLRKVQSELDIGASSAAEQEKLSRSGEFIVRKTKRDTNKKKRLSINNLNTDLLKDLALGGSSKRDKKNVFSSDSEPLETKGSQKRFSTRRMSLFLSLKNLLLDMSNFHDITAPATRKQSYDVSLLSKHHSKPRLEKSTSAALPKFITDNTQPKKIGQKLKRSLGSKKELRKSVLGGSFISGKQPVNMSLIANLLDIMGVSNENCGEVLLQIEEYLPNTKAPTESQLSARQSTLLDDSFEILNNLLEEQKKHRAATLIQSTFKTVNFRKRLKAAGTFQII